MELQVKMTYHLIPIRVPTIKNKNNNSNNKKGNNKCRQGYGEIWPLMYCWECKMVQPLWKMVHQILKKLDYDPAVLLWSILPPSTESKVLKRYEYTHVHSSIILTSQKMKATQVCIQRRMDEENVVHPYDGILFSLKKKGNSDACYSMNEPWGCYDSSYIKYLEKSDC